ncbi:MAG: Gfo/Idh/MocA family oxidoreductase [Magnetospirillum sp. WYHS-4]
MIRLGLIGAGPWGRKVIATLRRLEPEGMTLVRVASGNPETSREVGPACEVVTDWRRIVDASDLDGVIITTPPALHAEMAWAAVAAGKAVFVEKPLTQDAGEARALLDFATQRQGYVLVDHIHLFSAAYRELKRRVAAEGPIRSIRSLGANKGPFRKDASPLWDYGPHDLSMCLDLLGEMPETVAAESIDRRDTPAGPGETFAIRLGFPSGVKAEIKLSNIMSSKRRSFAVTAEHAILVYDDVAPEKLKLDRPHDEPRAACDITGHFRLDPTPPLDVALKEFATGIAGGTNSLDSLRLGVRVVEVLARCEAALGEGLGR